MTQETESKKKYTTAVIISGIFGMMGIHHFYLERWGMGILDLGMFVASGVLYFTDHPYIALGIFLIDFIHTIIVTFLLLTGQYKDGSGKLVTIPNPRG